MDAVGSASLTEPPWGDGPGRSARDDLAEPNGAERHPGHLPVLASDHVRLGALVVVLEHADRFAEEPVRQLELEGHTLADVLGRDEVLSAHGAVAYPTAQRGSSASRSGSSRMATSAPNARPAAARLIIGWSKVRLIVHAGRAWTLPPTTSARASITPSPRIAPRGGGEGWVPAPQPRRTPRG